MKKSEAKRLVQMYKDGKKETAIEQIYVATLDSVYRYVFSRAGRQNWTEDIVSETYLTLIEILDKYSGESKIETFIIGIARNKIRQFMSRLTNDASFNEDFFIEEDLSADQIQKKKKLLDIGRLKKVMEELTGKYRDVLENRFMKTLTIKETALEMNESEANVRVLQHRALKKAVDIANQLFAN